MMPMLSLALREGNGGGRKGARQLGRTQHRGESVGPSLRGSRSNSSCRCADKKAAAPAATTGARRSNLHSKLATRTSDGKHLVRRQAEHLHASLVDHRIGLAHQPHGPPPCSVTPRKRSRPSRVRRRQQMLAMVLLFGRDKRRSAGST